MDFTVGQVAREASVNVETIRFYERKGILPNPRRSRSGYRLYSEEDVSRIRFIKRSQDLGFSLREVAELLSLRVEPGTTCRTVLERAEEKLADIEGKIHDLNQMKKALRSLVSQCRGKGPTSQCPILEYLELEVSES